MLLIGLAGLDKTDRYMLLSDLNSGNENKNDCKCHIIRVLALKFIFFCHIVHLKFSKCSALILLAYFTQQLIRMLATYLKLAKINTYCCLLY